jgi:hypothetical protein
VSDLRHKIPTVVDRFHERDQDARPRSQRMRFHRSRQSNEPKITRYLPRFTSKA